MENNPFSGLAGDGLPPVLVPNPPAEIPTPLEAGDGTPTSPFIEALDIDKIKQNLVLDRPLKLFIPNMERYPNYEFRIINSIPHEIADAHNKGFREVTQPELTGLFTDLVAGTDKDGKAFRPILCARPKEIGQHVRKQRRMQLRSLYAGMDPSNKEFNQSKYTSKVDKHAGTFGDFTGANWRIKV